MDLTATVQRVTRIDYLDGLGIAVGAREVTFVHLAKRFFRVVLRQIRTLPLPEFGRDRAEAFGFALTQFLQDIAVIPDQVVLCLPRRSACVSRLIVPETARGSLSQVIDYEAERLLPFPKDDIYYDYLTSETGGEEKRLGVTIFCLPRREVEDHLELLAQAQVRPQIVTLSTSALTTAFAFCDLSVDTPSVLVAVEDGDVEFSVIENQRLAASHLFSRAQVQEHRTFADLLAQGITRYLPGASPTEIPIFACGGNGTLPLTEGVAQDLSPLLAARFARAEEEPLPAAALPALGAALQAVGESAAEVNLLPPDKRAHREKRLSPLTLVLVGLIVVLGGTWAVGVVVQERRILKTLEQQRAALEPQVRQVQAQEEETEHLTKRLQTLDEAAQRRVLPLLADLSDLIPPDVYLTNFRYKDGGVELSGVAARPAADLVALLESSPCLRNVAPKAPFTKTANGETFTLGAQVEPCS